jgi:hypothetical protein
MLRHKQTHGGTFTFLHAISKRPLLVAQASCRDAERQDDGMSRLCCDTIGPDGLRILTAAFGAVSLSSIAPPSDASYVTAEALGVCVLMNPGEWTRRLFCFASCCVLVLTGY